MRKKMSRGTMISILGLVASLAGFAVTQAQNWISEQEMSMMIDEKIEEALAKREESDEESEEES